MWQLGASSGVRHAHGRVAEVLPARQADAETLRKFCEAGAETATHLGSFRVCDLGLRVQDLQCVSWCYTLFAC